MRHYTCNRNKVHVLRCAILVVVSISNVMPVNSAVPNYVLDCVRSLPPLPAAVNKLLLLAREPDADFRQITRVIETDQTLTARTLKASNSAIYMQPRRVETVRQATVLLGRETLLSLAVGASVTSLQNSLKRPWPGDPAAFWRHSLGVGMLARALAKRLRTVEPETAFVAGLLHDIGKLIMLNHYGDVYAQVLMASQYGTKPLHLLERETFEINHAVMGHALCLHWNLPPSITHAVAEHHDTTAPAAGSIADFVRDANELVKTIRFGDGGNRYTELRPSDRLPHNQVPMALLREMLVYLPVQIREAERIFGDNMAGADTAEGDPTPRFIVHLHINVPEERELLSYLLLSMQCEPVPLDGTYRSAAPEDAPLIGIITDAPLDPARALAYAGNDTPVLDYAAWKSAAGQPIQEQHLDVHILGSWLEEHLIRSATASLEPVMA